MAVPNKYKDSLSDVEDDIESDSGSRLGLHLSIDPPMHETTSPDKLASAAKSLPPLQYDKGQPEKVCFIQSYSDAF